MRAFWTNGNIHISKFNPNAASYFCKQDRLQFYPVGTKIYSRSRGIISPKPRELHYTAFEQVVQGYNVDYEKNVELCVTDTETKQTKIINNFTYRTYKKNSKKEV
jgi:hypothetical protein